MKICVVVARFSLTAVPLTQIRFARARAARGHDVDLVFGHVGSEAKVPDLGAARLVPGPTTARGMVWPLCRYVRRAKRYSTFSSDKLNGFTLLAALMRPKERIGGSSRVDPVYIYSHSKLTRDWVDKQAVRADIQRTDVLTCVSEGIVQELARRRRAPHGSVYSLVVDRPSRACTDEPAARAWFVDKTT